MGMLGRKLMVLKVFTVGMVLEDEMLLEFADALDFAIVNTWFNVTIWPDIRRPVRPGYLTVNCVHIVYVRLVNRRVTAYFFVKRSSREPVLVLLPFVFILFYGRSNVAAILYS